MMNSGLTSYQIPLACNTSKVMISAIRRCIHFVFFGSPPLPKIYWYHSPSPNGAPCLVSISKVKQIMGTCQVGRRFSMREMLAYALLQLFSNMKWQKEWHFGSLEPREKSAPFTFPQNLVVTFPMNNPSGILWKSIMHFRCNASFSLIISQRPIYAWSLTVVTKEFKIKINWKIGSKHSAIVCNKIRDEGAST